METITKNNTRKYSTYKNSGVEWLGEIPEHWEVKKLKLSIKKIIDNRGRTPLFGDIGIPMLEIRNITNGLKNPTQDFQKYVLPETVLKYERDKVQIDDILISTVGATSGKVVIIKKTPNYFIAQNVIGIRFTKNINPLFMYFFLRSEYFISSLELINKGNTIDNLKVSVFINNICFYPPLSEQTKIAEFLDDKTKKIDEAIAIKAQQINLLKERKQILIHKAVTRGLDTNVKLKNSGVEWIGEIPVGWEVRRLASFGKFSKGGGFSKADLIDFGVSAILYGDIYTKYDISIKKEVRFISKKTAEKSIKIDKHDLLFTGSGETKEDIGKCVVFLNDKIAYAGGDVIIFKQTENDSLFLSFALNTEGAKFEKARYSKGEIIVHTYGSKLRNIYIPIPPLSEQKEISSYIEKSSEKIANAISLKAEEIEKLKEYKSSLINSVVTGKVRVC